MTSHFFALVLVTVLSHNQDWSNAHWTEDLVAGYSSQQSCDEARLAKPKTPDKYYKCAEVTTEQFGN